MRFEMEADTYFVRFIMERVYRGTVLEFTTILDEVTPPTGWVTGMDEDWISICDINCNYRTKFIQRQHIVTTTEMLTKDGKPYKIEDITNYETRREVLSYTRKLREKAGQLKEDQIASRFEVGTNK